MLCGKDFKLRKKKKQTDLQLEHNRPAAYERMCLQMVCKMIETEQRSRQ